MGKIHGFALDERDIVTHDVPDGPQTTAPDDRRKLVIAALVIAAAAALVIAVIGLISGSDDDPPAATADAPVTGDSGDETTQNFFFMTESSSGEAFSRLDIVVGPDGQISGMHVFVRFGDNGDPYTVEEEFGGTYTDGHFELTGLSDTRPAYVGTLEDGVLTIDGTFGPASEEWEQIPVDDAEEAAAVFDEVIAEFTPEPFVCEDEGEFGCGEN